MAQRRPRQRNRPPGSYEKRPASGSLRPIHDEQTGLTSVDAHELATRIAGDQTRWRVTAIRLTGQRRCGVVLADSRSDRECTLLSAEDWRLLAEQSASD